MPRVQKGSGEMILDMLLSRIGFTRQRTRKRVVGVFREFMDEAAKRRISSVYGKSGLEISAFDTSWVEISPGVSYQPARRAK